MIFRLALCALFLYSSSGTAGLWKKKPSSNQHSTGDRQNFNSSANLSRTEPSVSTEFEEMELAKNPAPLCVLDPRQKGSFPAVQITAYTHTEEATISEMKSPRFQKGIAVFEGLYPGRPDHVETRYKKKGLNKPKDLKVRGMENPELHSLALAVKTTSLVSYANDADLIKRLDDFIESLAAYDLMSNSWRGFARQSGLPENPEHLKRLERQQVIKLLKKFNQFHWKHVRRSPNVKQLSGRSIRRINRDLHQFLKQKGQMSRGPLANSLFIGARNVQMAKVIAESICEAIASGEKSVNVLVGKSHLQGLKILLPAYVSGLQHYRSMQTQRNPTTIDYSLLPR